MKWNNDVRAGDGVWEGWGCVGAITLPTSLGLKIYLFIFLR